ncbi:ABC transporter substrate-binding protein [Cellvibrio japonicus]|nr:ABC transporter substrate-binding protein [Cellvibrio japonicus]QEI16288.1 ABC transporter substrate-binding protein [Cellvibrio japonicus]QEI19866.1 ABC transporter substrate-binding protein [Cellvibrio japonicus]
MITGPTYLAAHGFAQFGNPKYPSGFSHFEYVNPDAPKGGVLNLSNTGANSSFDKFNPFSLKGRPAPGLMELIFETLTVYSLDERNTQYGLLADDIDVAGDFTWVIFRLNSQARFSNGDPVTAEDVKYSYDTLSSPAASPIFAAYFSEIKRVEIIDPLKVRFVFSRPGRDLPFVAGSLPVFSPKWGLTENGERVPFAQLRNEPPIATGPYRIERAIESRGITYARNPDYWGKDIPVRRGTLNFDQVVYKLYKDRDTQVSALRAGQYDFFMEHQMRYWCCQYIGHRFDTGELIKEKVPHQNPPAMVGHGFNLRHERFQNPKVREALNYALDFEWVNQKIFDNHFGRVYSYFATTPLAASGLPSKAELAILAPWRNQLDPAVFGPMVELPSTKPPSSLRKNLLHALKLFGEAGWYYRDNALRNDQGEPFVIEVSGARGANMLMDPYYLNLGKIGIEVKRRQSDPATGRKLMQEFKFDFAPIGLREARMPGAELWRKFNSADADVQGSENILGVKSPVIDALILKLMDAQSYEEMETTARALDRVLMHGHYIQPWRYLTHHHIIYHKRLQRPATLPLYFNANEWVISTWWDSTLETP